MTAADKRVDELLERWLASVDRHARYLSLDDAAYARAENWPRHQRPNALVVNLARTRLRELQAHLVERRDAGDTRFAEALELMSFLTGLLGSEHLQRFIPLATGKPPDTGVSATVEQPRLRSATRAAGAQRAATAGKPQAAARTAAPGAAHKVNTGTHRRPVRASNAAVAPRPPLEPSPAPAPAAAPAAAAKAVPDALSRQVIADAVRMLAWGREWPAVAGLIARMADRPSEADIWKILRAHRTEILAKARHGAG
jgi:hypothetical protein